MDPKHSPKTPEPNNLTFPPVPAPHDQHTHREIGSNPKFDLEVQPALLERFPGLEECIVIRYDLDRQFGTVLTVSGKRVFFHLDQGGTLEKDGSRNFHFSGDGRDKRDKHYPPDSQEHLLGEIGPDPRHPGKSRLTFWCTASHFLDIATS